MYSNMNNMRIKKVFALFFTIFAGCFCARAQFPIIVELPYHTNCDTAIVRNWNTSYTVVYSKSVARGSFFYLVDPSGVAISSAPTDNDVKDMEINEDTVYYCGVSGSGNPIFGFFTITDLTTSTCQDNVVNINFPTSMTSQCSGFTPKKIEAFHLSDGVHAIVLVDAKFPSDSVKKVLVDIYKPYPATIWNMVMGCYDFFYESSNIFYCDDIAVTDNFVFLIGHKRMSAGIYMRRFKKPLCCSGSYDNIFHPTGSPNFYDIIYCYAPSFGGNINILGDAYGEHSVYCTHTEDDNVAIACMASYFDGSSSVYGTTVKNIDVTYMALINEVFHPYSTVYDRKWEVRDLRYNPQNKNILMLHDMNNPIDGTFENVVTAIDYPAMVTATMTWPTKDSRTFSIDKYLGLPFGIASAGASFLAVLRLYRYQHSVTNCIMVYYPNCMSWMGSISDFVIEVEPRFQQGNSVPVVYPVALETFENICSE